MRRLIWLGAMLVGGFATLAQQKCDKDISGKVIDRKTGEPIAFANVMIKETQQGAVTDDLGSFLIKHVCEDEFDLVVSFVGYKTSVHHHDAYHDLPVIMLATDDQLLNSIVIEGDFNPTNFSTLNLSQLDADELHSAGQMTFGDLAGKIAGVSTITTGQNVVKPMIHGLHSNRILIINNGVRHEFQNWGVEHAPELDPSQIDRLEVVKGAATVRYGPDALGGVILVNPRPMELLGGLNAEVGISAATNGRAYGGHAMVQQGWHHWVLGGEASFQNQGDLHSPEYVLTNTGKQEKSFAVQGRYHHGRWNLETYMSYFSQNLGILRGSVSESLEDLEVAMKRDVPAYTSDFSYSINNPRQQTTHYLAKFSGSYVLSDQKINFQYAYQRNLRQEYDVRRGSINAMPSIDLELSSHSLDLDWIHPDLGLIQGTIGVQSTYQDNNNLPGTATIPFIPNFNNSRIGAYMIEKRSWGNQLVEAGVRYDFQYLSARGYDQNQKAFYADFNVSQWTSSLGYKIDFSKYLVFQSNMGLAWRPPSVSELFSFGKHGASLEYGLWRYQETSDGLETKVLDEQQRQLQPEIGLKWINVLTYDKANTKAEITAYANHIRNFVYSRPYGVTNTVRGAFPYFLYDQTDAILCGADLIAERGISRNFDAHVNGSYLWARDISNKSVFVEMPPMNVGTGFSFKKEHFGIFDELTLGLNLNYTFRYFQAPRVIAISDLNSSSADVSAGIFDFMSAPKGYFLPEILIKMRTGKLNWSIKCTNPFNSQYRIYTDRLRYFADQTGTNLSIHVNYTIK